MCVSRPVGADASVRRRLGCPGSMFVGARGHLGCSRRALWLLAVSICKRSAVLINRPVREIVFYLVGVGAWVSGFLSGQWGLNAGAVPQRRDQVKTHEVTAEGEVQVIWEGGALPLR